MIIVSGKIYVRSGARHEFLAASLEAVGQARRSRGCRDLIDTRLAILTGAGLTSVSSHWNRPPPSKSITAATTGGESEYASRSTVKVAIVAGMSASRSGAIRSTAWHFTHTRCGGACRVPQAWQRLPVKANFHDSARNDGAAAGRSGS